MEREELKQPKASAPYFSLKKVNLLAISFKASSHELGTKRPSFLISGSVSRLELWIYPQPNAPFTHVSPWLDGLLLRPRTLTIWLSFASTTNPQPVPQKLQIVSVVCNNASVLKFQTSSAFP